MTIGVSMTASHSHSGMKLSLNAHSNYVLTYDDDNVDEDDDKGRGEGSVGAIRLSHHVRETLFVRRTVLEAIDGDDNDVSNPRRRLSCRRCGN